MKWTLFFCAAASLAASVSLAAEPRPLVRQAAYNGSNWWARYGAPVAEPEATIPAPGVVDPIAIEPHGWNGHGHDYVYYPGICDYTPPCTDWLWQSYAPNPCRCHPHFMHGGCGGRGCANGACGGVFGGSCGCGCANGQCGKPAGCGAPVGCSQPLAAPKPPADLSPTASLKAPQLIPVSSRRR
ncbi:MAG: hypothetical protein SFU86_09705 [Pirellulaceae bacterium]|nr:hypothetical protein [Pirellulaceae bacterium]